MDCLFFFLDRLKHQNYNVIPVCIFRFRHGGGEAGTDVGDIKKPIRQQSVSRLSPTCA